MWQRLNSRHTYRYQQMAITQSGTTYLDDLAKSLIGNVWTVVLIVYGEYFTIDVSHSVLTDKDKINWPSYGEELSRIQFLIAGWVNNFDKLISVENLDLVTGLLTVNDQPFVIIKKENVDEHIHRYLQEQAKGTNS